MERGRCLDPDSVAGRAAVSGNVAMEAAPNAVVRFFAPPLVSCAPEKSWRHAAQLLSQRLRQRYGITVRCEFVELFSPESFEYPEILELIGQELEPPFITVNGRLVQRGSKFSERAIREELERLGFSINDATA